MCVWGEQNKELGRVALEDTIASPLDWRALALGRIPPPAIAAPWGRAEIRRAPPPPLRTQDGMATVRQREVARRPRPVQHPPHVSPGQKTGTEGSHPSKDNLLAKAPQASSQIGRCAWGCGTDACGTG